ncbi:MAG: lamin tail domain-containing protein [Nonlabens sp.]|uniref:lamin tail domain-containing protein n=1 Tax=Nonlabens sp. TaxID=1888209 RepID=UPI003EF7F6F6
MRTFSLLIATAIFSIASNFAEAQIVINEINYKDSPSFETKDWVEFFNSSTAAVDVSNWVFKDSDDSHAFTFPTGTTIPASGYLVIAQELAVFRTKYPNVNPVLGDFTFGLSGGGELIRLFDANGNLVDDVDYDDVAPWPVAADGNGPTLELNSPTLDNSVAGNWSACATTAFPNGTPGAANNNCTLSEESVALIQFTMYPNPMVDQVNIQLSHTERLPVEMRLYDITGRMVRYEKGYSDQLVLERENLVTGTYILSLTIKEISYHNSIKLVVQ